MEKNLKSLCEQFAEILRGKAKVKNGVCTVSFKRELNVTVQGRKSTSILGVDVLFEALDHQGKALNLMEIAILQEELPAFIYAAVQQGIIIGALHNHWLFTSPQIMYLHLQSIESPLRFAEKIAYAFTKLSSLPVAE